MYTGWADVTATNCEHSEGPQETNYFLESRNVVPLRTEFKPPPILLSRKGPITQSHKPPIAGMQHLDLKDESSEDEEDVKAREVALAERQALAAREREEKQRKYEERRQELFGTTSNQKPMSRSSNSSPGNLTPPGSRSSTPSRGRGRGRRGGSNVGQSQSRPQQRELYDPSYAAKPDSTYVQRRENDVSSSRPCEIQPIRAPKGPDGTGRGGFGFSGARGGRMQSAMDDAMPAVESTT